ncbi:MAG: hypothetical protein ACE5OQ_09730 [Woeseia sp.]
MGTENTITEQDMDAASRRFVQGLHQDNTNFEPDLAVDGLTDSILSSFIRLITFRRS